MTIQTAIGSLEKQIEDELNISPTTYATLNTLFFLPNILVPLTMNYFTEYFGNPATFVLYAVSVGGLG